MALPFIATALIIATAWNLLTDWVWIGGALNFLPKSEQDDIQKRALSIKQLIDSARNLSYSATKVKRKLSQQERVLIKDIAETAKKQIDDLKNVYSKKFVLYGKKDVLAQLNTSTTTLLLELQTMQQDAGLIPRAPVKITTKSGFVSEVFDGDTIQINQEETVRLVGIDAPESTTSAGEISKKYLKNRLLAKMVKIESDPEALMDIYGRRLGVVYLNTENINIEMMKKGLADFYDFEPNALVFKKQWKAAADEAKPNAVSAPKTKIFSGIITQGKLGKDTQFIERQDDIIDSMTDLQIAAENNLTSFLMALPGKIIYEIKTTPEITTKSGFRQRGTSSQIITGYKKDGTPKYKTVLNKFAILNIYVMTEKNIRTKIQSIVLGPMDAVAFQPAQSEIINVEKNLQQNIFSKNIEDIKIIESKTPPVLLGAPEETETIIKDTTEPKNVIQNLSEYGIEILKLGNRIILHEKGGYGLVAGVREILDPENLASELGINIAAIKIIPNTQHEALAMGYDVSTSKANIFSNEVTGILNNYRKNRQSMTATTDTKPLFEGWKSENPNRCFANSIAEFFDAKKINYPGVQERAEKYQEWGLGQAAYYTGTGEQNDKLLKEIKKRSGCPS